MASFEMYNPKEYAVEDLENLVMEDFDTFTQSIPDADVVTGHIRITIDKQEPQEIVLDGKSITDAKEFLQGEIKKISDAFPGEKLTNVKRELAFTDPETSEMREARGEKMLTNY